MTLQREIFQSAEMTKEMSTRWQKKCPQGYAEDYPEF